MRHVPKSSYRSMPWRNGGGTTLELLREPSDGTRDSERFLYRVSIADVRTDGPFSRFDGYDRHIMLVAGEGMTLTGGPNGPIELRTLFQPASFSGDWDIEGTLRAGPVRDFNFMVDRARASSRLEVRVLTAPEPFVVESGTLCIVHMIEGALRGAEQGETLVANTDFELEPVSHARVALCWLTEESPKPGKIPLG
jgi:uncharacterized protein